MKVKSMWIPTSLGVIALFLCEIFVGCFSSLYMLNQCCVIGSVIFFIVMFGMKFFVHDEETCGKVHKSVAAGVCAFLAGLFAIVSSVYRLVMINNIGKEITNVVPDDAVSLISCAINIRCIVGLITGVVLCIMGVSSFVGVNKFKKYSLLSVIPVLWGCSRLFELFVMHSSSASTYLQMLDVIGVIFLTLALFSLTKVFCSVRGKNDKKNFSMFVMCTIVFLFVYDIFAIINGNSVGIENTLLYITEMLIVVYLSLFLLAPKEEPNEEQAVPGRLTLEVCEWVDASVSSLIVVMFVFTFIFKTVTVTGTSMCNTLMDKDRLVTYSFMYEPQNNDIVVIHPLKSMQAAGLGKERIIKRVIAIGGQTVRIDYENQKVYVDDELLDETYISSPYHNSEYAEVTVDVPEGYIFVLGDNREVSMDSRSKAIGLVKNESVFGKAVVRFWPVDTLGLL